MRINNSNLSSLAAILGIVAIGALVPCAQTFAQTTPASVAATQALAVNAEPQLLAAVLKATGYESRSVHVSVGRYQIVVSLVNSALSTPMSRQTEAVKIAVALGEVLVAKPEFKSVQAFHIDYVAETSNHADTHLVDAIDFRRDPSGNFVFHKS
ncbi:MAG: hypothetical protein ABL985_01385 [Casimicrobium sp.]